MFGEEGATVTGWLAACLRLNEEGQIDREISKAEAANWWREITSSGHWRRLWGFLGFTFTVNDQPRSRVLGTPRKVLQNLVRAK